MAYDKTTNMQTLTVSASFAQCQANFVAIQDEAMSIAEVYTFAKSPVVPTPTTDMQASTKKYVDDAFKALYPIGALYISTVSTNPATLLGFGTWVAFGAGKVMVGINASDTDFDVAEETGGVKEVTLSAAQSGVPAHTHNMKLYDSGNTGVLTYPWGVYNTYNGNVATDANTAAAASAAHTNLQPYIVCYFFKRSA